MPRYVRRVVWMLRKNRRRPDDNVRAKDVLDGIKHFRIAHQIVGPAKMEMRLSEFDRSRLATQAFFKIVAAGEVLGCFIRTEHRNRKQDPILFIAADLIVG